MSRLPFACCVLLPALTLCAAEPAGDPADSARPRPAGEALTAWEWKTELPLPPDLKSRWADFLVPPAILDKARQDLADLRLRDQKGQEGPYALRIRRPVNNRQPLAATVAQQGRAADRSWSVTLDLGAERPEHNEVAIDSNGRPDFIRKVTLEASDKPDGDWLSLRSPVELIHLVAGDQKMDVRRFTYPASHARYVRVKVAPGPTLAGTKGDDAPEVTQVTVFHAVQVPGVEQPLPASLGYRENVNAGGGPGSAWNIELGGLRLPVDRVTLNASDDAFVRSWRLEVAERGEWPDVLAGGEWLRRGGEEKKPLEIRLEREVLARRLRFVVTDFRNTPLSLTGVACSVAARELLFAPAGVVGPLSVYYGDPRAAAPGYDFAHLLPQVLSPPPQRVEWAQVEPVKNPEYRPAPLPLSERLPWLVYVVLGLAGALLLLLLLSLARQAVRRQDAPTSPSPAA
jgi:hypothetical protein